MVGLRGAIRDARYALPGFIERWTSGPGAPAAMRRALRQHRRGMAVTLGYFQAANSTAEDIVAANLELAALATGQGEGAKLSIKAPPLGFDEERLNAIAEAASRAGMALMFDAHAQRDADRTLQSVQKLLTPYPGTGFALPARWKRSIGDAAQFRSTSARIRLVKGEWADPEGDEPDVEAAYCGLATALAGRAVPVAVATHDPRLAETALKLLLEAGTPCELEQLRGLPRRRTTEVARRLGVPIRLYLPFGPGWWPYAIDKALERPYLLSWMISDWLGSRSGVTSQNLPSSRAIAQAG